MSNVLLHNVFEITSSYQDLFWDEGPVLYSGFNRSGYRIIGSITREDLFDRKIRSHIRALVSEELYARFLSKGVSYLEVLQQADLLSTLEIDLGNKILEGQIIEFESLDFALRPSVDSFFELAEDSNYGLGQMLVASFDGARSTRHVMGAPFSQNLIGNMVVLFSDFYNHLKAPIDYDVVFRGTKAGSMKFLFEIEHREQGMFHLVEAADYLLHWAIQDCGKMFDTGVDSHLSLSSAESSEGYQILTDMNVIYPLDDSEEEVAKTVLRLRSSVIIGLNDILGRAKGEYSTMTLGSCDTRLQSAYNLNEQTLLAIDSGRKHALRNADMSARKCLDEIKLPETHAPGVFTIEVYDYNRESGRGWAYLIEDGKKGPKIKIHVNTSHKPFTTSLDEAREIRIPGTMYYSGKKEIRLEVP